MSQSILTRPPQPSDLRITYGTGPQQFADLRLPEGAGPHPCVIAIHGGFWQSAYNLDHLSHLCAALTNLGLATWSLEYRRLGQPGGGWPGTFLDIARGVGKLFEIAEEYQIDPERVVTLGHSAGGQLASWIAGVPPTPPDPQLRVSHFPLKGAVSLAGVLDLRRASQDGVSNGAVESLLGGTPEKLRQRYETVSPIDLLPLVTPHLAVHGTTDWLVPVSMSERFHKKARELGGESSLLVLPATGHFELIDPRAEVFSQISSAIVTFVTS